MLRPQLTKPRPLRLLDRLPPEACQLTSSPVSTAPSFFQIHICNIQHKFLFMQEVFGVLKIIQYRDFIVHRKYGSFIIAILILLFKVLYIFQPCNFRKVFL